MIVKDITTVPYDCKCSWATKITGPPPNEWWTLTKYVKGCPHHSKQDEEDSMK